jgi:predicted alpha/beta-fold hydrolase
VRDFMRRSNPMPVAKDIAVPVLIVNALDDPICDERCCTLHALLYTADSECTRR